MELDVFRVHFRDNERDVRIHAEEARVVDDDGTCVNSDRSEFLGNACACRREHEVNVLEGVLASQFNLELFALETVFAANAAFGGEKFQVLKRKVTLFKNLEEFLTYCAGGAHDRYVTNHRFNLCLSYC